ncbi:monooxygenase [Leptospira kobayashii]|uniref:Flavin-containing monooxygenase 5 n=1 Tax=Leptospira kobayashii TaxID=1917830 RepID=A0ABM7UFS9_9LEPT|nr:NAD(P)-binding domain-containing protein [Leptospira kobayashii]BDA77267.1 monooxygenase [Leptospira kobayashii]
MTLPRVCVIGAGSSGITVIKSLKENGIPFDCYEKGSDVGGNWRYKNDNGLSNIYKSLHINTHRDRMEYRDYPMPTDYADYPNHEPIQKYFGNFVDHFGLRKHIQFKNGVKKAERTPEGIWKITPEKGPVKYYDVLVVANGHHWSEKWPDPAFPGKFTGETIHSHSYVDPKTPVNCEGKNVVILGMGNSAMDISVELSRPGVSKKVFLSSRRGAYVIPNYLFGKPLDKLTANIPPWVPFWIQQTLGNLLIRYGVGKMEDFGLPKPDHKFGSAHPTVSQDLLVRLGRGDIKHKAVIKELKGKKIQFADGSEENADVLIYCTGYAIKFPFFDENFLSAPNNYIPLFFKMIKPEINNLMFVGLMQPLGAIMPLAEMQGKWIAQYLSGNYKLPSEKEMNKWIKNDETAMRKRYVSSARHTIQVDFDSFLYQMKKEMKSGKKRADAENHVYPIPARAEDFEKSISKANTKETSKPKKSSARARA